MITKYIENSQWDEASIPLDPSPFLRGLLSSCGQDAQKILAQLGVRLSGLQLHQLTALKELPGYGLAAHAEPSIDPPKKGSTHADV